ncbi:hypothetical protein [Enterobacter cancerogenus]|uniref:hypothetical protein n=1 Tax=Enterobacter cancerogenus TaxID=69218 RepID=UPI0001826E5E|nr:hypothetical protein [Enterobacter cancerogenus]EFC56369.1 hypothetical protein ENTCAN_06674 [Enterobacter cancerogenus ATCC 35316]MDT7012017.1 hypothetical protein [Enterobacter cancerogenus]WNN55069.1 hypothetical protein RIN64_12230 [Enterobacter cancerogenus]CAD5356013.1 conserved protein of unknown function [Enterobacter cancerogenus]
MLTPKQKAIIWALGIIFGVPTSIYGVQWTLTKFAKQQVNCLSDASQAVIDLTEKQLSEQGDGSQLSKDFTTCRKKIDPNKGTVDFFKDEIHRHKSKT